MELKVEISTQPRGNLHSGVFLGFESIQGGYLYRQMKIAVVYTVACAGWAITIN